MALMQDVSVESEVVRERKERNRSTWKLSILSAQFVVNPKLLFFFLFYFIFCLFAFSRVSPSAYGGSQARSRIGAVAAGLRQSHSNTGSKPRLQPTPQFTATPDP